MKISILSVVIANFVVVTVVFLMVAVSYLTTDISNHIHSSIILGVMSSYLLFAIMPFLMHKYLFVNQLAILEKQLTALLHEPHKNKDSGVASNLPLKEVTVSEFHKMATILNGYCSKLAASKKTEEDLFFLAHTDTLTGLGNRLALNSYWDNLYSSGVAKSRMSICFAMIDANDFKGINDTYGHAIGDVALEAIAATIKNTVREGDMVYRLGGDEFVVMFLNTALPDAAAVMARCSNAISNYDASGLGINTALAISVGVSVTQAPFSSTTFEDLKRDADVALYNAKGHDIIKSTGNVIAIPPA